MDRAGTGDRHHMYNHSQSHSHSKNASNNSNKNRHSPFFSPSTSSTSSSSSAFRAGREIDPGMLTYSSSNYGHDHGDHSTSTKQQQQSHDSLSGSPKKAATRVLRRPSGSGNTTFSPEKPSPSSVLGQGHLKSPRVFGDNLPPSHINVRPVSSSARTPRSTAPPFGSSAASVNSPRKSTPFQPPSATANERDLLNNSNSNNNNGFGKFLWRKNEVDIEPCREARPLTFTTDSSFSSSLSSRRSLNKKGVGKYGKILELEEEDDEEDIMLDKINFYREKSNFEGGGGANPLKKSVSSCTVDGLGFDLETINLTNDTDRRVISKHECSTSGSNSSAASSPSSSESSIKKLENNHRRQQLQQQQQRQKQGSQGQDQGQGHQDGYDRGGKSESSGSGSSDNDNTNATPSARRYISVESLVLEDNFNATTATTTTTTTTTTVAKQQNVGHKQNSVKNTKARGGTGGSGKGHTTVTKRPSSTSSSEHQDKDNDSDNSSEVTSSTATLANNYQDQGQDPDHSHDEEIPRVKVVWTTPPHLTPRRSKDSLNEDGGNKDNDNDQQSDSDSVTTINNNKNKNNSEDSSSGKKRGEKAVPGGIPGTDSNNASREHANILNFFTRTEDGVEKEGRFDDVQPILNKFFSTTSAASTGSDDDSGGQLKCINLKAVLDNMDEFVLQPAAIGYDVQCRVTRDRKGVDRGLYPTYYMHLERPDGRKVLLLTGRKRKKSTTSNYLISTDAADLSRDSHHFVGKVRSNLLGTQFTIYDHGQSHKRFGLFQTYGANAPPVREEIAAVIYEPNVLGFKGPRKMKILIPEMKNEARRREHRPDNEKDSILELHKQGDAHEFFELKNKAPIWNDDNQSFVLNFHGRVTQASVKNFQIIHEKKGDYVVLQFGRVASDLFTMDFRYPLCALQAFAIVLTSFDNKLACE